MKVSNSLLGFLLCSVVLEEVVLLSSAARVACPAVSIKNGKVKRRRERARFITFDCKTGFLLAGGKHSTCSHGKWDPPPPLCIRASCMRTVLPPANGFIYPSHGGAALHFFCNSQFVLRGPQHVYCDGLKWDNNAPICLPKSTKPVLSCDFEDDDLCGWTHDLNHDFDWKRERYNTPSGSIGTGPSWDHTKGQGEDGYYMYIESSSRNENDTAKLISPIYDRPKGEICFEFFYHMFGSTTGSLRVYLKKVKESWNLRPDDAFFSLSGNQGNRWYRSFHALGTVDDEFQIVIEGVRGPGYISDIAIDDVSIFENCTGDEMETTTIDSAEIGFTEPLAEVDTCQDRCGTKDSRLSDVHHLTCDCDDECYDNNRCCPDFFDYCTAGTYTTGVPTTDMPNEIAGHWVTMKNDHTTAIPTTSSAKPGFTTSTTTTEIYVRATTLASTRETTTTTTARPTPAITTHRTPSTTPRFTSTKLLSPKPTIMLKTPPTTRKIAFRTPSTTTTTTTTIRPVPKKTLKPGREIENDVIDLPVPTKNDEVLFILTTKAPDDYMSKEYWSDEDLGVDKDYTRHINESVPLFSVKSAEGSKYNVLLIIIGTAGILVLVSVITFTLFRRWRDPRNRMSFGSSNGASQSDVRFLSHDEMIDFTLPKDYEDL